jgi:DNA polymerase III subunit delta'
MLFKDVIGQDELKSRLLKLAFANRLPHAMLITECEGSGGMTLALALAQYIMCTAKTESDACGQCSSCIKMSKLQHPDMHFSFPTYRSDAGASKRPPVSNDFIREFREFIQANPYGNDTDWLSFLNTTKQGNITATECRDIISKLQMRSFESAYKILIMWYPEYLDKEGNILLKLIEEPTPGTLMMFVTANPDKLLATIRSRTQLFPLYRLKDTEIKAALIERGADETQSAQYARIAEGDFRKALMLLQHTLNNPDQVLRNWLNAIYTNNGIELVNWIQNLAEQGKETQKRFLEYVIQLLEHVIRFKYIDSAHMTLIESEQKMIEALLKKGMDAYQIREIANLCNESMYEIERNANIKILLHALSLRIQKIVLGQTMAQ